MPAARERQPPIATATMRISLATTLGTTKIQVVRQRMPLGRRNPTRGACAICTGMFSSGAKTGTRRSFPAVEIRTDRNRPRVVYFAVAATSTAATRAGRPARYFQEPVLG